MTSPFESPYVGLSHKRRREFMVVLAECRNIAVTRGDHDLADSFNAVAISLAESIEDERRWVLAQTAKRTKVVTG